MLLMIKVYFFLIFVIMKTISKQLEDKLLISIFRHGEREAIAPLIDKNANGEITKEGIEGIKSKEIDFIRAFPSFKDITKDNLKLVSSESNRAIESLFHRLSVMFPQENMDKIQKNDYKDYLKNNFNMTIEPFMFNQFYYCKNRIFSYFNKNLKIFKLITNIESILKKNYFKSFKLWRDYYEFEDFENTKMNPLFRYIYIADSLNIAKDLDEDQKNLKDVLVRVKLYKELIDSSNEEENINIVFTNSILTRINQVIHEYISSKKERKEMLLFSCHDYILSALLKALGIRREKIEYHYNDEINIIVSKDTLNRYFVTIFYNANQILSQRLDGFDSLLKGKIGYSEEEVMKYCENKINSFSDLKIRTDL